MYLTGQRALWQHKVKIDDCSRQNPAYSPGRTFSLSKEKNVIYMNTFSKTISSSLRIGYMVLPKDILEVYDKVLGYCSCPVPTYMQLVVARLIENGDFERHINRIRRKKRKEG